VFERRRPTGELIAIWKDALHIPLPPALRSVLLDEVQMPLFSRSLLCSTCGD